MLDWITGALAISGRIPEREVARLAYVHHINTVIDLRAEWCDDAALLASHGLSFLHLPTPDLAAVTPDMLDLGVLHARREFRAGRRVLVHCEWGIGRSALLALCILSAEGMAPLDALRLAKARRPRLSPSPAQYDAWAGWLMQQGLDPPGFAAFSQIAYSHLAAEAAV